MRVQVAILAGLAALVASCSTAPNSAPFPMQTANGRLGFSISGIAQFTRDETAVEAQVRGLLEAACGGAIELLEIELIDASSQAGVPHTAYSAVAECQT